ncbi:MAG: hypothetical protein ACRDSF_19455 [Pseudonocardiaceae bacterium]
MATHSVDDVAAELYAVEPPAFVAARTDAARAAREAGDSELAAAIGKLRRPALAAWAVNLLARDDSDGLERLLALGEELREAQQQLRGEALQRLSRQRREAVAALTRRARQLAADAGHPLGADAARQVEETLGAAVADPDAARDVRGGRLVTPLRYAGFGPAVAQPRVTVQPGRERLEGELRERLERELAQARREVAPLAQDAQRAALDLERADDAVADAQRRLAAVTERRDAAARRAQAADRARRDAEGRVQYLTEQLDQPG